MNNKKINTLEELFTENKSIEELREYEEENIMCKLELQEAYPRDELQEIFEELGLTNKHLTNPELELYYEMIRYIKCDYKKSYDINLYKNMDNSIRKIKESMLIGFDTKMKDLIINHQLVSNTLTDFMENIGEENNIDIKVENIIDLYIDKLENNEISEEIIKYELDLPKKGNRDTWMNLIDGIVELSSGKSTKFIEESNKLLTLYKKEK